jgi:Putative Ig domain
MQAIRSGSLSFFTALMIVGCGGGDGGGETSSQTNSPPVAAVNAAPTIQGQPGTSIVAGEAYSFQVTASDANGDTLTFSATNLPAWLSLNTSTGRLTGTPSAADVGSYDGVKLSVWDGQATASLSAFTISVAAIGVGSATVSWVVPTHNTDGSSLADLTGFTIRYGRSATALTESVIVTNPSISSYVVENLGSGAWYFAVVAVNSAGLESAGSNVASKTIA